MSIEVFTYQCNLVVMELNYILSKMNNNLKKINKVTSQIIILFYRSTKQRKRVNSCNTNDKSIPVLENIKS